MKLNENVAATMKLYYCMYKKYYTYSIYYHDVYTQQSTLQLLYIYCTVYIIVDTDLLPFYTSFLYDLSNFFVPTHIGREYWLCQNCVPQQQQRVLDFEYYCK